MGLLLALGLVLALLSAVLSVLATLLDLVFTSLLLGRLLPNNLDGVVAFIEANDAQLIHRVYASILLTISSNEHPQLMGVPTDALEDASPGVSRTHSSQS